MKRNSSVVAVASAASALAAAVYELEHRRVSGADLRESQMRVQRLWDLQADSETLEAIGSGLQEEWGPFAFLGFADISEMAAKAGQSIFVARRLLEGGDTQTAVLQTIRGDFEGDPLRLLDQYPTFSELTSRESWSRAAHKGGDTVVLLQIAVMGRPDRGAGLGSLLRNAALHIQPSEVKFALTTTPVDKNGEQALDLADPHTFTGAMRFHQRGGAEPTRLLSSYKTTDAGHVGKHGTDVVVMRYQRNDEGAWPSGQPPMRLRHSGPMQQRLTLTWRRIKRLARRRRIRT